MATKTQLKEIIINDVEKKLIFDFAHQTSHTHYSRGRNIEKLRSNVIQGKIGEVGFYLLFRDFLKNLPDLSISVKGDSGYDFLMDFKGKEIRIDVKTIKEYSNRFYFNPKTISRCDFYCIVKTDGHKVTYLGKISAKKVMDEANVYQNDDKSVSHSVHIDNLT